MLHFAESRNANVSDEASGSCTPESNEVIKVQELEMEIESLEGQIMEMKENLDVANRLFSKYLTPGQLTSLTRKRIVWASDTISFGITLKNKSKSISFIKEILSISICINFEKVGYKC